METKVYATLDKCLINEANIFSTTVHNICDNTISVVPNGTLDIVGTLIAILFAIVILAMFAKLVFID